MNIGDHYWSQEHQQLCQIVEIQHIFGQSYCRVWLPQQDAVVRLRADKLRSAQTISGYSPEQIRYIAAAAKIKDVLSEDILLAPMEASVIPLPHQIRALTRAMSGDTIRYLLADEVGLGKTIEAGLIIRELKLRGLAKRILIVAPKGLVTQWVSEMKTHFNEEFRIVLPEDLHSYRTTNPQNPWAAFPQAICPMDTVKPIDSRRGRSSQQIEAYNQERFGDLVAAGWDLAIVDEAHRLAGSSDRVARYRLGKGLAESAPYLLLLSATPHQGKTEAFYRLMALLDEKAFPNVASVTRDRVQPYVIRTAKRQAIDVQGKPLFQPRQTQLIAIAWQAKHYEQQRLYEAVTEYAREGYNQAVKQKKNYVGFLMILMQRLVTSSTRAIRTTLERRLEVLREPQEQLSLFPKLAAEEFFDLDGQEQVEMLLGSKLTALKNERAEVELLLEIARKIETNTTDAKAEALLDWIYHLQQKESAPDLKVLIFTEFLPTQEMLKEFLSDRGISVVCLNGSMNLADRKSVQESFANDTRVLISTDAGGEGLNLQFCHVIINYDIPWNPMRLEQRIGRVDRIGQKHLVRALNFVFKDTVEYRVREVLEQKLEIILKEFGVDKTGDVLDSAQAGEIFDELFVEAMMNPTAIEEKVTATVAEVRSQAQLAKESSILYDTTEPLDPDLARQLLEHPLHHWVELMVTNYLPANGGTAQQQDNLWHLTFPTGDPYRRITFDPTYAEANPTIQHLTLEHPQIRGIIQNLPKFSRQQPIPCLDCPEIAVRGTWSLWMINAGNAAARIFPLFLSDDGRVLSATARQVWSYLLSESWNVTDRLTGEAASTLWDEVFTAAGRAGQSLYEELVHSHRQRVTQEQRKYTEAFTMRRTAIERIGLSQVRTARLNALEQERQCHDRLQRSLEFDPELTPILLVKI
jgi:ERCC4-related helicase